MFKEEEEAIKVDLHEGCGRTKLFWLMALADSKTMKAMVEFREHTGNIATERTLCFLVMTIYIAADCVIALIVMSVSPPEFLHGFP